MNYEVSEPFEIPRSNRLVDKGQLRQFWDSVAAHSQDPLGHAIGCYVFSLKSGGGVRPWYVGRSTKQIFMKECFAPHKLWHYNEVLASYGKCTPYLTLVVKRTPKNKFAKVSKAKGAHKDIKFLEQHLIGLCLDRNPDLRNVKDTSFLRNMVVPGVINSPQARPTRGAQSLKTLLFNE